VVMIVSPEFLFRLVTGVERREGLTVGEKGRDNGYFTSSMSPGFHDLSNHGSSGP